MNNDLISRSSLRKKIHSFMSGPACMQAVLNEPAVVGPEWISVNDKLPEDLPENAGKKAISCMVATEPPRSFPGRKPRVTIAQRQWNAYAHKPRWEWSRNLHVTHWMPPIEPPEVKV